MKASLSFDLPDESEDYSITSKALETHAALKEFEKFLKEKYRQKDFSIKSVDDVSEIYERFYQVFLDLL